MRLRPFIFKIAASRAELLSQRVSRDILKSLKNLNSNQIKDILRGFVPLDFVALLRQENPSAFEQAFHEIISQKLNITQYKKWIEELGITKEDAINEIYLALLNNDPKKRGVLSEISLDGSYSDAFQYAKKEDPSLKLLLKQTAGPISSSNGVVVPFCPTDKALGINKPLWNVDTENGQAKIEKELDSEGRCLTYETLGEMTQEEFESLKETKQGLTPEQIKQINSGQRSLEFLDGEVFLRCTFKTQLPKFQNFLDFKIKGIITSILSPERAKMGRNIPPEKYHRRDALEAKEKAKTINTEEIQELKVLRDYFQKKQVEYTPSATSLDTTMKSDESEGKSLHDIVNIEDDQSIDQSKLEEAVFELQRKLGKDFDTLAKIAPAISLGSLLSKADKLSSVSSKDPNKKQYEQDINLEALKLAQKYLNKDQDKREITCLVCSESYSQSVESCTKAKQMRSILAPAYKESKDIDQFKSFINQLDEKSRAHYDQAHIESKVKSIYAGVEVSEDDLLEGIDFSGFESADSESSSISTSKLDERTFKQTLEEKLDDKEKAIYQGNTIVDKAIEVSEEDLIKVQGLAKLLKDLIAKVVMSELEEEFATYLLSQGTT